MSGRQESFRKWLNENGLDKKYKRALIKFSLWSKSFSLLRLILSDKYCHNVSINLFIEAIEPLARFLKDNSDFWDKDDFERLTKSLSVVMSIKRIRAARDFDALDSEVKYKVALRCADAMCDASDAVGKMMNRRSSN